eukprot:Plantae.Rhodophyta-Hildenbrandia_rubra.ctg4032.p1 GENE.Plantae.Rhodophyta-Hildenbrandia_rubra.ctg4032~~Plantae.Rhodophyta-Hildenbrandia_rubra.ctg4032.p1  ORF type:complete len:344 (-),score=74.36 Plantae.Rhodophyta-Hildenbrandia_rubra.ctg4032:5139-6092(-)
MELLTKAVEAAQRGHWRQSASHYLQAHNDSPRTFALKYFCLTGYTSIFIEESAAPTADEIRALNSIGGDKSLPLLHRMHAWFANGLCKWLMGDREGGAECYREAIRLNEGATRADRKVVITRPDQVGEDGKSWKKVKSGELMDELMKTVRENLEVLEGKRSGIREAGRGMEDRFTKLKSSVAIGPHGDEKDAKEAMKRLDVGGGKCDQCGVDEGDGIKMKTCGRCKMVYYCSEGCQRAAWKAMHKKGCRAPGQVEVGDWIQLVGLEEMYNTFNGTVVVITEKVGKDHYKTGIIGGEEGKGLTVAKENVKRIRPKTMV